MIKLVMAGALVVGSTAVWVATAAASTAKATPPCSAAYLRPSYGGGQGAAGTLEDTWRLKNVGTAKCTVHGFPALVNYRSDGRPLRTHVTHTGSTHTVTLLPGQHASFEVRFGNPGTLGCTGQPATAMTIQVPGTTHPVFVFQGEQACHGNLTDTPLRHGG